MQKRIEQLKNIILVVLFLTTILLLYFFWENQLIPNFQLSDFVGIEEEYETIPLDDVIVPDNIYASSGNGVYVKVYGGKRELWQRAVSEIQKIGASESISVGEITKQQYLEAMGGYTSLQFDLGYEVPFSQFCEYYGLFKNHSFDAVEGISAVAYSTATSEGLFLVQEQKGKYYRLVAGQDHTQLRALAEEVAASSAASYYTISELMGVDNTTIIPWEASVSYGPLSWQTERQGGTEDDVIQLAQSFFGENFDFIRRMVDTRGNVTYMYGYGQKSFITYANGSFEYREELSDLSGGSDTFYGSLDTALQYISAHGSWHTFDGEPVKLFLSQARAVEQNRRRGYRFEFGLMAGDLPVYYDQGVPLAVEVIEGQVTYYQRNLVQYQLPEMQDVAVQTNIANVLASNYEEIYRMVKAQAGESGAETAKTPAAEERFEEAVAAINDARLGYFCQTVPAGTTGVQEMIPAWVVTVNSRLRLHFDVNSGALLGSRTLEQ